MKIIAIDDLVSGLWIGITPSLGRIWCFCAPLKLKRFQLTIALFDEVNLLLGVGPPEVGVYEAAPIRIAFQPLRDKPVDKHLESHAKVDDRLGFVDNDEVISAEKGMKTPIQ